MTGGALDLQNKYNLSGPGYLKESGGRYSSFLEETIQTTQSWTYILNDRIFPLRPFVALPHASVIDQALWDFVDHNALRAIRYPGQPFPNLTLAV